MTDKPFATTEQVVAEIDSDEHWIDRDTITYQIDGLKRTQNLGPTFEVNDGIHAMTSAQRSAAIAAFQLWDDLIPATLVRSHDRDADISLNLTADSSWHTPSTTRWDTHRNKMDDRSHNGEQAIGYSNIWIPDVSTQTDYVHSNFAYGTLQFQTFVHEIGHSLGLHHTGEYNGNDGSTYENSALFAQDTMQYSIMSYNYPWHRDPSVTWQLNGIQYGPSTPMLYDIATIQSIYGFDGHTRSGNTTYGTGQPFAGPDSVYNFSVNTPPVLTIYDAGGNDTLEVSMYSANQIIDLRPGSFSSIGGLTQNVAMAFNTGKGANPDSIIENGIGGSGSDLMVGNDADNKLDGRDGSDSLNGGVGNDNLDGGFGADTMLGGAGDDTYFVNDVGDIVSESDGTEDSGGIDTIRTNLSRYVLQDDIRSQVENLTYVLTGPFTGIGNFLDNVITGGKGVDDLEGGGGNDTLVGGAGSDTLIGGIGNDTYIVDTSGDKIIEAAGADGGVDTVETGLAVYDLGANVENLRYVEDLKGAQSFEGNGNELDNHIYGGTAKDILFGNGGNDYLSGSQDADRIFGNAGADTLRGGAGDDVLNGAAGSDTADYSDSGVKTDINLATGVAKVFKSAVTDTDTLYSIENVIAGDGSDKILGNGADNTFTYFGNFGRLRKDGGIDQYDGGAGTDTIDFSRFGGNIDVNLHDGTATASYNVVTDTGTFSGSRVIASFSNIENVIASKGTDIVIGDANDNVITYVGSYTATSDTGKVDTYSGGGGSDTIDFSHFTGTVSVNLDEGIASSSFSETTDNGASTSARILAHISGIENVVSTLDDDTITGDGKDNTLTYVGSYTVDSDTGGLDNFDGGSGVDTADFSRFDGHIWVDLGDSQASSSYSYHTPTSGGVAARLVARLTGVENAIGSSVDDDFEGDAGDNRFTGGGGNDRFHVTGPGFGHDVITDFVVGAAGAAVHDILDISTTVFADWDHLLAATTDSDQGAVITLDADDTITLSGVTKDQLTANHEADVFFV